MSQRNRYEYAAYGFITGLALAFIFLVWSFPGFRNPIYQQDRYHYGQNYETGKGDLVERPSFWETYTSPTDTYAQWIMAILSIFATLISVWAVWLVKSTLNETREAVRAADDAVVVSREANEILKEERRTWLSINAQQEKEELLYRPKEEDFITQTKIVITNHGNKPAVFNYFIIEESAKENLTEPDIRTQNEFVNFNDSPFKEIVAPNQSHEISSLIETRFGCVDGGHTPAWGGIPESQILSGRFVICIVYCAPNGRSIWWTTKRMHWHCIIPVSKFDIDNGWSHPFQMYPLHGNQMT